MPFLKVGGGRELEKRVEGMRQNDFVTLFGGYIYIYLKKIEQNWRERDFPSIKKF